MKWSRAFLLSFVISLVVWMYFSWPLAGHLFDGISASSRNIEAGGVRAMMPSDQLQLLYHFRLFQDMLTGDTPWFHNLYEFNTGNDGERFWPSAYFFPFSLIYAAAASVGGAAFGMNIAGFVSLWLTLLFTWQLLGRLLAKPGVVLMASLISILLPFRWAALMGGSPTGYAMVYVPLLALGIDIAIRDRHWRGGMIAGLAILLACWGDVQTFAFCGLSLPFWCVLSLLVTGEPVHRFREDFWAWARALIPLFVAIAIAFAYRGVLQPYISGSTMSMGRDPAEIALFSPTWTGLFSWVNRGVNNHVYIGYLLPATLGLGSLCLLGKRRSAAARDPRFVWPMILVVALILGVCLFALGPHGPMDGLVFRIGRKLVPGMSFLRQPAKAFCLLPTLFALGISGALVLLSARWPERRTQLVMIVPLLILVEYGSQVRATVNLLDPGQGAYYAVAKHAEDRDTVAHALVIPLWPGDSDLVSVYEYFAGMYRIRMVNGYSPVVATAYFEDVFRTFESANQGLVDDRQLDALVEMGVGYILVHEDLFPEKVSPFPVTATLQRLLTHPRVELLRQDESVWAFRILERDEGKGPETSVAESFFPTRRWELEQTAGTRIGAVLNGEGASGPGFARLDGDGQWVATRPTRTGPAPRLRWAVRVRGDGMLRATCQVEETDLVEKELVVDSETWTWLEVPFFDLDRFGRIALALNWVSGTIDLDMATLTAGRWSPLKPGQKRFIPAISLFHAGYGDGATGQVHFRKRYEPDLAILYGPQLPLEPGDYLVNLQCSGPLEATEEVVGQLRSPDAHVDGEPIDVVPGRPNAASFTVTSNLPVRFEFIYNRAADVVVDELVITRIR